MIDEIFGLILGILGEASSTVDKKANSMYKEMEREQRRHPDRISQEKMDEFREQMEYFQERTEKLKNKYNEYKEYKGE